MTRPSACVVVVIVLSVSVWALPGLILVGPASATVVDPKVLRFDAVPSHINLNRTTNIEVEIGDLAGLGNYTVTVTAPDSTTWSEWYNFTAVGTMGMEFGNATGGFMAVVDQVGTYNLTLEYFDGTAFSLAGVDELEVTDQLDVLLVLRASSDPLTGAHVCPQTSNFVRGAKFLGGAYVYYASTGEPVTTANSNALGNVTGSFLGIEYVLTGPPLWHKGWKIPWNVNSGVHKFYVNASDGMGNFGSAETGIAPARNLVINPDTLAMTSIVLNDAGEEDVDFAPGDTVYLEIDIRYDDKNAHEAVNDPNPADPFNGPLSPTRGGVVTAHIGWGAFNFTSGEFDNVLTDLTLTYDTSSETWKGSYAIPSTTEDLAAVQAMISASDSANAPNTGSMFSSQFSIQDPETVEVEVPVDRWHNTTVSTGFEPPLVTGLAIGLLVVGLVVGIFVARSLKKNGGSSGKESME